MTKYSMIKKTALLVSVFITLPCYGVVFFNEEVSRNDSEISMYAASSRSDCQGVLYISGNYTSFDKGQRIPISIEVPDRAIVKAGHGMYAKKVNVNSKDCKLKYSDDGNITAFTPGDVTCDIVNC